MNKISLNGSKVLRSLGYNLLPLNLLPLTPFTLKTFFTLMVSVFMLTGCVEEFEPELPDNGTKLLVVSGTITSDTQNTFLLTWSTSLNSSMVQTYTDKFNNSYTITNIDPVMSANVYVRGSDGSEYSCKETADGVYQCILPKLKEDVGYHLDIKIGNSAYESTPEKPIRTPELDFTYVQEDSLSDIDFLVTTGAPDDPDQVNYFIWDYDETWEVRPRAHTRSYFDTLRVELKLSPDPIYPEHGWKFGRNRDILIGSTVHYPDGRFHRYKLYDIPRDDERIFWNYCSHLTQRAISKAEFEYHQATHQAAWEMGGLFTPQPSAPPSNIHCTTSGKKAIGYIGCSMNTVTLRGYLDGKTISRKVKEHAPADKEINPLREEYLARVRNGWAVLEFLKLQDANGPGTNIYVWWVPVYEVDIRLEGATIERPWYMPPFDGVFDD